MSNIDIEVFASVEIHDDHRRRAFINTLKTYGVDPVLLADKIEFRFTGSRGVVSRLTALCDAEPAHSIHVTLAGK